MPTSVKISSVTFTIRLHSAAVVASSSDKTFNDGMFSRSVRGRHALWSRHRTAPNPLSCWHQVNAGYHWLVSQSSATDCAAKRPSFVQCPLRPARINHDNVISIGAPSAPNRHSVNHNMARVHWYTYLYTICQRSLPYALQRGSYCLRSYVKSTLALKLSVKRRNIAGPRANGCELSFSAKLWNSKYFLVITWHGIIKFLY